MDYFERGNGGDTKVTTLTLFKSNRDQEEIAIEEAIAGGMPVSLVKYGSTLVEKIVPVQNETEFVVYTICFYMFIVSKL